MPFIYKYLPAERISYLQDALLRFTQPGALNDPFDCLPALPDEIAQAAVEEINAQIRIPPMHAPGMNREQRRKADRKWRKAAKQVIQERPPLNAASFRKTVISRGTELINSLYGILSLSRRWDSSLMWSHYTNSHAGFCVGFDRDHAFFRRPISTHKDAFFIFQPVVYSHERPLVVDRHYTLQEDIEFLMTIETDTRSGIDSLLTKARDWEYEEEERAIELLANANKTIETKPFEIALFEVPHDAVTEIIIGLRAAEELRQAAMEASRRLNVPLYLTTISRSSFNVERQRIKN